MESEADPGWGCLHESDIFFAIILTKFIEIDMMAVQASEKRMRDMIITKETDYALRILRVLMDGEKHSVAEMSETELIPNQFAYQILRKLSAGNLVRVSRGALGGCVLSCDLDATSLYDLMGVMGERGVLCACMEPGFECRWQDKHGRCAIHCQLAALQRKQDEAFCAVSLRKLLAGGSDPQDTSELYNFKRRYPYAVSNHGGARRAAHEDPEFCGGGDQAPRVYDGSEQ